ncbi:rust resistance kinase Lr10-like [Impatiens glandulifera]|uniref:rust resistance kinase Lr10-like n=1 Tax=Impatiens glandulifera TaxID=253017 RepID=UPI001FB083BF|nr:rust resistance kinase Lr10-like [Impatiens glandulifera]
MERVLEQVAGEKPVRFTSQQLIAMTRNYSQQLGSGGFGLVYGGYLSNGVKIAVKVLKNSHGHQAEEQFMAEVTTIGRTHHINLVKLYGFCYENSVRALVYEYMENGSLDTHLFKPRVVIEWEKLCEIAIGTAKGLAYLHEDCQQRIIHYDIKPANILLDANFNPKVADFGLAKLCNREDTHVTMSGYRGTPGYSAPEVLLHSISVTQKCDVYSFGMLLFEIIGRRKNTKVGSSMENDTLDWFPLRVWEGYEKGELIVALTMCREIEERHVESVERMAMVALWCVQESPKLRPPMSSVIRMLEGVVEITSPPNPFGYLFSLRMNLENDSYCESSSQGTHSSWYKETMSVETTRSSSPYSSDLDGKSLV